jgi:hypothetical protein
MTECEEGQIGGHRLGRTPPPQCLLAVLLARDLAPVGDGLHSGGCCDRDVHQRLVTWVVVAREPPRRHVRLVDRHHFATVRVPVLLPGVVVSPGPVGVAHDHRVRAVCSQRGRRCDRQFVSALALEGSLGSIDAHTVDVEEKIEVERRQVLGRLEPDPRGAAQHARVEVVGHLHPVAQRVDPRVAVEGEVGVEGRTRGRCQRLGAQGRDHGGCGQGRESLLHAGSIGASADIQLHTTMLVSRIRIPSV